MSNDAVRTSQLGITTTLANTDRVVVLTNPTTAAQTQTVALTTLATTLASNVMPIANSTQLGVIKIGAGLAVAANGVVTAPLPIATPTNLGVVKIGTGLVIDDTGLLSSTGGSGNTGNVTFGTTPYYGNGDEISSINPLVLRGNNYVTSVINNANNGFAELWWHNRDYDAGTIANNTGVDVDFYLENDGAYLYTGKYVNSTSYASYGWHWDMDGNYNIPSGGDIRLDGQSVINTPKPTPSIEYTGTFIGYPDILPVSSGKNVIYTANGSAVSNANLYWWDDQFYDGNYDLSGTTSVTLRNIGGVTGQVSLGNKSLNFLANIDLDQVSYVDSLYLSNLPALVTFSANNLAHVNGNLRIYSMDKNDSVFNFPNLRYVRNGLQFDNNDRLANFPDFPNLKHLDWIYINDNPALTENSLTLSALTTLNYMYMYNNSGVHYGPFFPNLQTTGYIGIYNNSGMIYPPSYPALVTCTSSIDIFNNGNMLNPPAFNNLQTVNGNLNIYQNAAMVTCPTLANLQVVYGNIFFNDNTIMNGNLNFESLKEVDGGFYAVSCALSEADVNYILHILANLDGNNGTTLFNNRNVWLNGGTNASPTGQGLTDKQTLIDRGCNVLVN